MVATHGLVCLLLGHQVIYITLDFVPIHGMHKDELLQLHSLLCQMKRYLADAGVPLDTSFEEYEGLNVSPQHIHKSKTDHKRAVFLLGKGISEIVLTGDPEHQSRLRERFLRLAANRKDALQGTQGRAQGGNEPNPNTEHLPAFALAALSG